MVWSGVRLTRRSHSIDCTSVCPSCDAWLFSRPGLTVQQGRGFSAVCPFERFLKKIYININIYIYMYIYKEKERDRARF